MSTRAQWLAAFGLRLSDARLAAGLSQQAVADACGVNRQTVWRWEDGRQAPDAHLLALACEALGVSASRMLAI